MYDSELFYFNNLSNVCVYTNFIETISLSDGFTAFQLQQIQNKTKTKFVYYNKSTYVYISLKIRIRHQIRFDLCVIFR